MKRNAHSYSELKTFWNRCRLQHFYRYFMQTRSRTWEDNKFFIIGNLVHDTIERIYRGHDPEQAFKAVAGAEKNRIKDDLLDFRFREFRVKRRVAKNLIGVFQEQVRPDEPFEIVDTEVAFQETLADVPMRGMADRLYRISVEDFKEEFSPDGGLPDWAIDQLAEENRDYLRLIGEEKTRSTSTFPGTDYEKQTQEDLQTHLYWWALKKAGTPVEGIVHTSYRKAPSKYRKAENYDSLAEQKEAIDGYYSRARTPYRRAVLVPWRPDPGPLEKYIRRAYRAMEEFYDDPYNSADSFVKYDPGRMPCRLCDYFRVCHENQEIDHTYAHKPDTS